MDNPPELFSVKVNRLIFLDWVVKTMLVNEGPTQKSSQFGYLKDNILFI